MNFNTYTKLNDILVESVSKIQKLLSDTMRPAIAEELMKLLNEYVSSPLAKYIIKRIHTPDSVVTQTLTIGKVGNLESYSKDKYLYDKLLQVKSGDIGPGEILTALTLGEWVGGEGGDFDIIIKNIGKVEVKYLVPFARSTNVPMGSAESKRLVDTDIPVIFKIISDVIRENPKILKRYMNTEEMEYFIDNTIDHIEGDGSVTTNGIRLIARMLKNAEQHNDNSFMSKNLNFDRFKTALEKTIHDAMGDAEFILFIGNKIKDNKEIGGKYYLLPKSDIKYYMFYRIYDGDRIKIAPFTTESDFLESRIYNK